jgi:hypothetical protein
MKEHISFFYLFTFFFLERPKIDRTCTEVISSSLFRSHLRATSEPDANQMERRIESTKTK